MRNLFRSAAALTAACGLGLTGLMSPSHAASGGPLPASQAGTLVAWGDEPGAFLGSALDGTDVVDVAAGTSGWGAAVKPDGSVVGWGAHPSTSGLSNVASVAVGAPGLVALKQDHTVAGVDVSTGAGFADAPSLTDVTAIAANGGAAAAVADGAVHLWGALAAAPFMAPPSDLSDVTGIAGGNYDFTAVQADHTAESWGLGAPAVPADVQGSISSIDGGLVADQATYAAVLTDGSVQAWNAAGEITTPAELDGETVVDVSVNGSVVALTADGQVFSWGSADGHTLADFPAPSSGVVTAVAAGQNDAGGSNFAVAIVSPFKAATAPSIAGTAVVGQTLTATAATFSLTPDSVTGQWLSGGTAIPGATGATLALTSAYVGKQISYRSTGVRGTDTVTSDSAPTAAIVSPFKAATAPSIAGTAVVGSTLTATPAAFSLTPDSVTGQWLSGGTAIPGATGATLALTSAYVGKQISYRSTGVRGTDTVASDSAPTAVVAAPSGPGTTPPALTPAQQKLSADQAKLTHDRAKLTKAKKAYKKAHGAKKAKLKKKVAKLQKQVKTGKKHVKADKADVAAGK